MAPGTLVALGRAAAPRESANARAFLSRGCGAGASRLPDRDSVSGRGGVTRVGSPSGGLWELSESPRLGDRARGSRKGPDLWLGFPTCCPPGRTARGARESTREARCPLGLVAAVTAPSPASCTNRTQEYAVVTSASDPFPCGQALHWPPLGPGAPGTPGHRVCKHLHSGQSDEARVEWAEPGGVNLLRAQLRSSSLAS